MTWTSSYTHTLAIAVDTLAASVFFNRPDLTISTMCWMVTEGKDTPLRLWRWQRSVLAWIGPVLDRIQSGHMAKARDSDTARAQSTLDMLGVKPQ